MQCPIMLSILSEYSCDLTCGHRKCDTHKPKEIFLIKTFKKFRDIWQYPKSTTNISF